MMTSELWDADGQAECAGSSVGAAGDLRQVFWREQREPVLMDSCTWDGCLYSVTVSWDITCLQGVSSQWYSQCGGMMTELGELHQRILAAQARIQHNIVRTPVLRSAQSQHTRA